MKEYPNFYENLKEANMRLRGTVVMYDGEPHYLFAVTDHKGDGVFRAYLHPLPINWYTPEPPLPDYSQFPGDHPGLGTYLDDWIAKRPNSKIIRKFLSSPQFNKFRPFPLGMCNVGKNCLYIERQPNRRTEQGLTRNMLSTTLVSTNMANATDRTSPPEVVEQPFTDCIKANHPSAQETLTALLNPDVENTAVGFHRYFALVRGPIGMLFLAYKTDIVGVLPNNDLSRLRLGREFLHTKEVIQALNLFNTIEG